MTGSSMAQVFHGPTQKGLLQAGDLEGFATCLDMW
jgi:hypothetical protein